MSVLMEAKQITAGYDSVPAIREVSLTVEPGEIVALLGANGAGKSTTLRTLMGATELLGGSVEWQGDPLTLPTHKRARAGISYVPEERSAIMGLSAADNLRLGGGSVAESVRLFPELEEHLGRRAGLLSGGQQQMIALARALTRRPLCLLADELSFGLAPVIVSRLLQAVTAAADRGLGVILVEQHASKALAIAHRAYVLVQGRVEIAAPASDLMSRLPELETLYLGGPSVRRNGKTSGEASASSLKETRP